MAIVCVALRATNIKESLMIINKNNDNRFLYLNAHEIQFKSINGH